MHAILEALPFTAPTVASVLSSSIDLRHAAHRASVLTEGWSRPSSFPRDVIDRPMRWLTVEGARTVHPIPHRLWSSDDVGVLLAEYPPGTEGLWGLETIDLGDDAIARIAAYRRLRYLAIRTAHQNPRLTSLAIDTLAKAFESLEHVWIEGATTITDEDVGGLEAMAAVKTFGLRACGGGGGVHALRRLARLRRIEALSLIEMDSVEDMSLRVIGGMKTLKELNVSRCTGISDLGMLALRGLALNVLVVTGCTGITDKGLAVIREMPLTQLNVGGCTQLTAGGLVHAEQCPLHYLNVSMCSSIGDEAIEVLKRFEKITQIVLRGSAITARGLDYLKKNMTHLVIV